MLWMQFPFTGAMYLESDDFLQELDDFFQVNIFL